MRTLRLIAATFAMAGSLMSQPAAAQSYPSKPIRIVVPFVAGGSSDIVARSVAARMQTSLGQNVVVENRPGANGAIAAEAVMHSPPDGYTIMVGSIGTFAINSALYPKLSYDPLKDLEPLTLAVTTPNVLVASTKFPASSVKELIDYARKHPGKLTYASSGTGSSDHLSAELFKLQTGTFGVHIPYRGGAAAMADLMGGNVDVSFQNLGAAMPHIKSGRLKALAVTSEARRSQLPDTPTMIEQGVPGFVVTSWQAFMGPKGMPRDVVAKLSTELVAALNSAEVRNRFAQQGFDVVADKPEAFADFQRKEIARWREVVQKKGLTPD
ncbi:MAG TPA: tripartite tricarboxylate transporter substrate binding protein [Burkholderiaceae bacterium]|nr:tripartite tricarboxylate transporter substrate binding protein [Burkholderiaceae bacterium]